MGRGRGKRGEVEGKGKGREGRGGKGRGEASKYSGLERPLMCDLLGGRAAAVAQVYAITAADR